MGANSESPVFRALAVALDESVTGAQRMAAAVAIADHLRRVLPDRVLLDQYLGSSIDGSERAAVVGELAVELARAELLLGWSHLGGDDGGTAAWEYAGANRGAFPDHYLASQHLLGQDNDQYWCAAFAGEQFVRAGLVLSDSIAPKQAHSIFWSCYRMEEWARTGKTRRGDQATRANAIVAQGEGLFVEAIVWRHLAKALAAAASQEDREALVDAFAATHDCPRAGDIVTLTRDHAMMVERWDAEHRLFTSIEGNAGHAVRSHRYDLTDPATVGGIRALTRIGAAFFDPISSAPALDLDEARSLGEQLLQDARDVVAVLVTVAAAHGWVLSGDPDVSASEWLAKSTSPGSTH